MSSLFRVASLFLCGLVGLTAIGCQQERSPDEYRSDYRRLYYSDLDYDRKRRDVLAPPNPAALDTVLSTFQVEDGFEVELFAAEPLIADPIDMAVDEKGDMYVVQLTGYPVDTSGVSVITQLRDTDGDGLPDESTIFASDLDWPKGVMPWKDGIIVPDPPNVYYMEDTDEDGEADVRDVILTGFARGNPQTGVNNPLYGLDNWIYMADMMRRQSRVRWTGREDTTYRFSRQNVRMRPDSYSFEVMSGHSQFGHSFNTWGSHFLTHESNHIYEEVMPAKYLRRNPNLYGAPATATISDHGASAKVYPITHDPDNQLGQAGGITSSAGIIIYQGDLFPEKYYGMSFIAESIYNLLHADRLTKDGAAHTASRVAEEEEFLASTDRWFRPVNQYVGPDGALYVVDMCRQIIEHPDVLADEIVENADLDNGKDCGRIYRVVPENTDNPSYLSNLSLDDATGQELLEMLGSKNIWWRRTAQRLLVTERADVPVEALEALVREGPSPEVRLHALWTLEGRDALTPELLRYALNDESAGVRENAIKAAELHLEDSPDLVSALAHLQDDSDPHVRFQLLCTLGDVTVPEAQEARENLLFANMDDRWMQFAALSAVSVDEASLFDRAVADLSEEETGPRRDFFDRLGSVIGAERQIADIRMVLDASIEPGAQESPWWRAASLDGLTDGIDVDEVDLSELSSAHEHMLRTYFETDAPDLRAAYAEFLEEIGLPSDGSAAEALQQAAAIATDDDRDPVLRADAVRLLGLSDSEEYLDEVKALIDPNEPSTVQTQAVSTLGQMQEEAVGEFLLGQWSTLTPAVREQVVQLMLGTRERTFQLLDAVEAGTVDPTAIPRPRRDGMLSSTDDELRERAYETIRRETTDRQEVLEEYRAALEMRGDPENGKQVYDRACAQCHTTQGTAPSSEYQERERSPEESFGPDLGTVLNRSPMWLLTQILVPNKTIANGYELWSITRDDGSTVSGVMASETPTSVTLRNMAGETTTVSRSDIETMEVSNVSAMPAGLENQISKQEMADLLAYLMEVQTVF
jgi:putative membrane-bound dehydrogenase-like protein